MKSLKIIFRGLLFLGVFVVFNSSMCTREDEDLDLDHKVAVVLDSEAVLGFGHIAVVFINTGGVCTYYSHNQESDKKDGVLFRNFEEFMEKAEGNKFDDTKIRYDKILNIAISKKQYSDMMLEAGKLIKKSYGPYLCHHFVGDVLRKGGIPCEHKPTPETLFDSLLDLFQNNRR